MKVDDWVFALDGCDTDGNGQAGLRLRIITHAVSSGFACRTAEGNNSIFFHKDHLRPATKAEIAKYRRIYPEVDWYLED
jgi:hypothetical protein